MSDVTRYRTTGTALGPSLTDDPAGEWVRYSDYRLLRQEYSALCAERHATIRKLEVKNAAIKAENERLRRAGDVLRGAIYGRDESSIVRYYEAIRIWEAAKEGRDSK